VVPEEKVTKLDMSVAAGMKYIISLGAIAPEYAPAPIRSLKSPPANLTPVGS